MAKQVESKQEEVSIKNWDDWFKMCGGTAVELKQLEKLTETYYFDTQYQKDAGSQREAQAKYQEKHIKRFYERESKIPSWMYKRLCISGAILLVVGIIIGLIALVVNASKSGLTIPQYASDRFMSYSVFQYLLTRGLFAGIILAGLAVFGQIWYHRMKLEGLFKQMRVLEDKLEPKVKYIPPRYRNSQAVQAFSDLYTIHGVDTFNQAVESCDKYLSDGNLVGLYMAYLFDVPYANGPAGAIGANEKRNVKGFERDMSDPALPTDIDTKTFEGADDADARLNELVGLENVKEQVRQMKNRMDFYGGASPDRVSGSHMVFLGPPGTGKTTIARIITKILYDFGYIQENRCVEIDGGYLKSPFQGQTPARSNAIIKYAMGGVLFIDEAYVLTEDRNNAQGAEAVGILLKAMEDHRDDLVIIMAGYEDNMNRMLATNEGFASRIKHKIYFDNFSVDELGKIFKSFMYKTGGQKYSIEDKAFETLKKHFEKERSVPGFGNARVVRNAWDAILDIHADRFMTGNISQDKKYVISVEDVEEYIGKRQKQMTEDGRNFIASKNLDSSIISLQELKQKTKPGSENPDEDLARLTGLNVVKEEIARMKAQFEFYDGNLENTGNHMVFVGPPGTGKTTVASIMTGYLYKLGLIRENSYLDINGDFLKGSYLGHTGKRTEAVVQYAQGMVLFVDEAYILAGKDGDTDAFGAEAVAVLLDAMEKYRQNFVVIFAGYEKEMNDFLDVNSGLRSRINLQFHFTSYTPHELAQMMQRVAKDNNFKVDSDVWLPLQKYFKTKISDPHFGNGRYVRQFFEAAKKEHIVNFAKKKYGDDKKYTITLEDVEPLFNRSIIAE